MRTPSDGPSPDFSTNIARRAALRHSRLELRPLYPRKRLIEQTRIVAGVEDHLHSKCVQWPGIRHFFTAQKIAPSRFDGIYPHLVGYRIHHALADKGSLIPARRSIGCRRRFIRQPVVRRHFVVRNAVRPQHEARRHVSYSRAMSAYISTLVMKELIANTENATAVVDCRLEQVSLLARVVGGDQVLPPIFDPLNRPTQTQSRQAHQYILRIQFPTDSEAAADVPLIKMKALRAPPQHHGHGVAIPMRFLRRPVHLEHVARGVVACDRSAAFKRHARVSANGQVEFDYC